MSAQPEESQEAPKGSVWQIVYPGLMNVRSAKLYLSRVIGMKAACLMVRGTRDGDWVRLISEPGYMMISLNGTTLMEETLVTYELISSGTCASVGRYPISDLDTCQAAALALGLPETSVRTPQGYGQLQGCSMHGTSVFLTAGSANAGDAADGARQLVCSSHATAQPDPCLKAKAKDRLKRPNPVAAPAALSRTVSPATARSPAALPAEAPARAQPRGSLFCFSVVDVDGHGVETMVAQMENGAGVFSCDTSAVYSVGHELPVTPGWKTTLIPAPKGQLPLHAPERETLIFMEVWDAVLRDDHFNSSDWFVKVARDTVFFADRLHSKLQQPLEKAVFFLNCHNNEIGEPVLLGSLEVFSRGALVAYRDGREWCKKDLPWHTWGENTYIKQCLLSLGVYTILDGDMVADSQCQSAPCSDSSKVAFQGYRDASSYLECWEKATEVTMASAFLASVGQ